MFSCGFIEVPIIFLFLVYINSSSAIECFKCVSYNRQNPACDDPFHNNYTTDILEAPCLAGRKSRNGLFPATSCIKIVGVFDDNGDHLTVRGCALDSGTTTTDTELVRMSHCGGLYFDDRYVRGCVQSCNDAEACNQATSHNYKPVTLIFALLLCLYFFRKIH